jgi:hypothetical protein
VSFTSITLCVDSQRVIQKGKRIFRYDSVRKLLDTLSYVTSVRNITEKIVREKRYSNGSYVYMYFVSNCC